MNLIIDIPEKVYNAVTHIEFDASLVVNEMRKSIANGTPLEQIRAEVADLDDAEYEFEGYYKAVNDAVQIIDKYRKGESK